MIDMRERLHTVIFRPKKVRDVSLFIVAIVSRKELSLFAQTNKMLLFSFLRPHCYETAIVREIATFQTPRTD